MPVSKALFFLASLLFAARVATAESSEARAALMRGDYDAALEASANLVSADGLAFQSEVLLAEAMCAEGGVPQDAVEAALRRAEAALARDPEHLRARLNRAVALSLGVRGMDDREAFLSGRGPEARRLADAIIADKDAPSELVAYAHGFLTVWNIEVIERGGPLGARVLGASVRQAKAHYAEAARLLGDDAGLHWQYARALTRLNAEDHAREIEAALKAAAAAKVDSDLERVMQARAGELAARMEAGDIRGARAIAAKFP
jgi:hypothetical protein